MNLDLDDNDLNIVRSTIGMAHHMGLKVVAEGVETESVAAKLKTLGCDGAQGYLFSRPLNAEDFLAWATASHASNPPLQSGAPDGPQTADLFELDARRGLTWPRARVAQQVTWLRHPDCYQRAMPK